MLEEKKMYEKEQQDMQKKIFEIVKSSQTDIQGAVDKLQNLKKEAEGIFVAESLELYNVTATIYEAIGDIYRKAKNPVEAEKSYREMMKYSSKLYTADKEKYDYRQGISHYKFASLYRVGIQCNVLGGKPKQLNELQKKVFGLAEAYYKNVLTCIVDQAKKGNLRYVELHSTVMNELSVMYACIGNYEKAIEVGKNGITVDRTIYDKHDDKVHGLRLAGRMNALAAIYAYAKNSQAASEMLEDANYVLERHEEEEPVAAGIMLGRNYLNLGGCYTLIEEEKENAEETFLMGLNKVLELNEKVKGGFAEDVLLAQMLVGDFYKKVEKEETAKEHYQKAKEKAEFLYKHTKNPKYEAILKRLTQ